MVEIKSAKDEQGYGALHIAAGHHLDDVVKLLVQIGCSISTFFPNEYLKIPLKCTYINEECKGWSPLLSAVKYKHESTVIVLTNLGAHVDDASLK